ncbi:leucine-rich repeat domain-containing protein [Sporocytophaga myxococcoides]|uniref:leucine-rich repeat domain-containing protein n=1 Tax=Sporocytophaga myxococcoides TaxID=153721 RepID=UPI00040D7F76|nr:leucine-rich repeat domain-containing protein [Sporocytophaga myxococcoides]
MKKIIVPAAFFIILGLSLLSVTSKPLFPDYCPDAKKYTSLQDALAEPEKVVKLDISMLKLTAIPPEIGKLTNLECLDVSFNRITTLPAEMANLKKLRYIDLTGTNYMAKLPPVLAQLPNLQAVNISDHAYWKPAQFEEAKKFLPNVKMILSND